MFKLRQTLAISQEVNLLILLRELVTEPRPLGQHLVPDVWHQMSPDVLIKIR